MALFDKEENAMVTFISASIVMGLAIALASNPYSQGSWEIGVWNTASALYQKLIS